MKIKWNNQYVRWGFTAFFTIIASILFYYFLFHMENIKAFLSGTFHILMPILFGFVMAYTLSPLLNFIEKKLLLRLFKKVKFKSAKSKKRTIRKLSVLMTALIFFFIIYSLIHMLIAQIVPSIQDIINNIDIYVDNITGWVNKFMQDDNEAKKFILNIVNSSSLEIENFINNNILEKSGEIVKKLSVGVMGFVKVLWNFVIGFIISIYFMANKEKFAIQGKKLLYGAFDKDSANVILNNMRFTHNTFIGFIGGKLVDSLIIGMICFIGTTLMQTPYAALVSVIIGFTNIIPFFGPFLGAVPSAILIFVVDPMHPLNCLYFIIFILILQQVDGNIIGPKILGSSTGLSSFWVIFAITFFGGVFGIFGMVIGVPLFAVIYAAIRSVINGALIKKNLPTDSHVYKDIECIDEAGIHSFDSDERNKYIKAYGNKSAKEKKEEELHHQHTELVSGLKYMSNAEEWKRRVPVRWDDSQTITRTIVSFQEEPAAQPVKVSASEPASEKEKKGNKK